MINDDLWPAPILDPTHGEGREFKNVRRITFQISCSPLLLALLDKHVIVRFSAVKASIGNSYSVALENTWSIENYNSRVLTGKKKRKTQTCLENHSSNHIQTFLAITFEWLMSTPLWLFIRTTWNSKRKVTGNLIVWLNVTHPQLKCVYQVTRYCKPLSNIRFLLLCYRK